MKLSKNQAILWAVSETTKISGNISKTILTENCHRLTKVLVLLWNRTKKRSSWIWCAIMHCTEDFSLKKKVETCGANCGQCRKRSPSSKPIVLYVSTFAFLCRMLRPCWKRAKVWTRQYYISLFQNESVFIKQYLVKLDDSLGLEIVSYYTKFCVWLSRMESVATSNSSLKGIQNR